MAFSIPWLETVSKKERQRREEKAQRLMFPFGDEQRTAELAVLRALIQTKARDADLLFRPVCAVRRTKVRQRLLFALQKLGLLLRCVTASSFPCKKSTRLLLKSWKN